QKRCESALSETSADRDGRAKDARRAVAEVRRAGRGVVAARGRSAAGAMADDRSASARTPRQRWSRSDARLDQPADRRPDRLSARSRVAGAVTIAAERFDSD